MSDVTNLSGAADATEFAVKQMEQIITSITATEQFLTEQVGEAEQRGFQIPGLPEAAEKAKDMVVEAEAHKHDYELLASLITSIPRSN